MTRQELQRTTEIEITPVWCSIGNILPILFEPPLASQYLLLALLDFSTTLLHPVGSVSLKMH